MNTCGTCRHWGKDEFPRFAGLNPCRAVVHDVGVEMVEDGDGLPMDGGASAIFVAKGGTPIAVVSDGSGYFAALKTREDFGCRLWEPKP